MEPISPVDTPLRLHELEKPYIPVFILPKNLRPVLSIPQGTLLVSRELVKNIKVDYAVGDVVSSTLSYRKNIVDYKTRRTRGLRPPINVPYIRIVNPAGTLSINSLTMLKTKEYKTILVHGEEDLIPIGVHIESPDSNIGYGQPGVGVVVVKGNYHKTRRLLKAFKPGTYLVK